MDGPDPVGERTPLRHEQKILLLTLLAGLPATLFSLWYLWSGDFTLKVQWTLAVHEANILSETLREQRLEALEAGALLRKVMEEIEVAVFTFDGEGVLRLTNRAGERLLRRRAAGMLGRHAGQLGLGEVLEGPTHQTLEAGFPGGGGRWEVRRSSFRQEGRLHRLVVVTDLSRALREEERLAWQRLINLVRNAADAALETGGGVTVGWRLDGEDLEVEVLDEGPGLSEEADLFVPFYTTKPEGSGIGLALARQIAESHGGSLRLENRSDRPGCRATVRLPLTGPTSGDKRPLPSPGDPDIV